MSSKQLPKGFNCTTCDTVHTFPAYVFAHWDEELHHSCDNCGAKHSILGGDAEQIEEGIKPSLIEQSS